MKKMIFIFALACLVWACGGDSESSSSSKPKKLDTSGVDGQAVYKQLCVACHLGNGEGGINGAKDLSASELDLAGRIDMITNGSDVNPTMVAFNGQLSPKEIQAVAEYTMTFK